MVVEAPSPSKKGDDIVCSARRLAAVRKDGYRVATCTEHKDATLYGAGPAKIGSIVGGGADEGRKLLSNFLKGTPALKKLQEKVAKIAEKGTLPGLDGRRVHVRSPHAALNTLLQSAGAIISKQWLICLRRDLQAAGIEYKQINYSHDEVELEVDKNLVDLVKTIAVKSANQAGEILGFRCPVDAEAKDGTNWYDVH